MIEPDTRTAILLAELCLDRIQGVVTRKELEQRIRDFFKDIAPGFEMGRTTTWRDEVIKNQRQRIQDLEIQLRRGSDVP